jgi:hypothetical protein
LHGSAWAKGHRFTYLTLRCDFSFNWASKRSDKHSFDDCEKNFRILNSWCALAFQQALWFVQHFINVSSEISILLGEG